jgi:GTPase SAR1 family protein
VVTKYVEMFRANCPQEAADNVVLVGNKVDDEEHREVSRQEAQEMCHKLKCFDYFETSAASDINVDEAFFSITARAFHKQN